MKFFRHFIVKKIRLPLSGERFSCLYLLINKQYVKREKLCLRTKISLVPRENKGFGNLLNVNFVRRD